MAPAITTTVGVTTALTTGHLAARAALTATPRSLAAVTATATVTQPTLSLSKLLPTPTPLAVAAASAVQAAPIQQYIVKSGDTLYDIATEFDVSVDDLLAANGLAPDDAFVIQPGQEITIPNPEAAGAEPPAAAKPTPAPQTYTVRAGDTLIAIAVRLDVATEDLLAANGMTINDARTLRPGQELLVPVEGEAPATAAPTATPTVTPTATPTATPAATITPTPTAESANTFRLDAPKLRAPEDNAAASCITNESLNWEPVPFTQPTDLYVAHLGYVSGRDASGQEQITWVLAQQRPYDATSWALDNTLCGLAPAASGRQWRWYVDVAAKTGEGLQAVSPPSPTWRFTWQ